MAHQVKRVTDLKSEGATVEVIVYPPAPIINEFSEKKEQIPQYKCVGLIDTGASNSCIDKNIAEKLNLISRDFISVLTPSGCSNHYTYDIGLMLIQLEYKTFFIEVTGADLEQQPFDVLIGRDILDSCTLIYNGWDNSFQIHI